MVAAAREVIAIVDHTKWERAAFATFCAIDQVGTVLTDPGAPTTMMEALRARGVDVRIVSAAGTVVDDLQRIDPTRSGS
jgi:DeoR/GlpR family transcriptional regulator of sugar metabolism